MAFLFFWQRAERIGSELLRACGGIMLKMRNLLGAWQSLNSTDHSEVKSALGPYLVQSVPFHPL